jgi:formylglycine-generating enzyme required for sulfatase activity
MHKFARLLMVGSALSAILMGVWTANSQTGERKSVVDEKGISMVYVPAGEFDMGVTVEKAMELCRLLIPERLEAQGCDAETTLEQQLVAEQTRVSLAAFYIDQYEVSMSAYLECVDADVCSEESLGLQLLDAIQSGDTLPLDHPIDGILYFDAAVYCAWRQGRLPTEAEWEYAARSPQSLIFPWGNEFDSARVNFGDVLYENEKWEDGYPRVAPVNRFEDDQSWVGAYNMAGNVSEWTSTTLIRNHVPDYYTRIAKGGNYASLAYETAAWMRVPMPQIGIPGGFGFRCARTSF